MNEEMLELIKFNVGEKHIATLLEQYGGLCVSGLKDVEGYKRCKVATGEVRKLRVSIEKRRKELKADSLEFGRKVDGMARVLMSPLIELESKLKSEYKKVDDEKERIKKEAEEKKRALIDARMSALARIQMFDVPRDKVAAMTEEAFQERLVLATGKYQEAQEKKRQEEEKLKAEAEALRLKAEAQAKEIAEMKAKIEREEKDKRVALRKLEEAKVVDLKNPLPQRVEAEEVRSGESRVEPASRDLVQEIRESYPTLEKAWTQIAFLVNKYQGGVL